MNLAVLASPDSWYVRDLRRAAGQRHTVAAIAYSRIAARITDTESTVTSRGLSLSSFDSVLVRSMPPGSLEQVVFRMDALQRLESSGRLVLNSPKAIEVAVDKYLALAKLQAAGLPVPRTETSQTVDEGMESFHRLGQDVVLKPLFGSEGRGITRITDPAIAERTCKLLTQLGAVIYLQEFVAHEGFDMRLLTLGSDVLGMRRSNHLDWRTNVSRGAVSERLDVSSQLGELARRAADAVGAVMAGVDLLPAQDGRLLVIEVNAVPGWRALAKTSGVDVARRVLQLLSRSG